MSDVRHDHQLTETANDRIFRSEIVADHLPVDGGAAAEPTLILISAPSASGLSALMASSRQRLEHTGPVLQVVADELRIYHPDYAVPHAFDEGVGRQFAQDDAEIWAAKLRSEAIRRQVGIVVDASESPPTEIEAVLKQAREAGYRTEVHAIGVNPRVSWQAEHVRFEELHQAGLPLVRPVLYVHDVAAITATTMLGRVEQATLADRIEIQTPSGVPVYKNSLAAGQWQTPASVVAALEAARNRPLSREEIETFAAHWELIVGRMQARSAPSDLIDEIRARSREDFSWLAEQRRRADESDADNSAHSQTRRIGQDVVLAGLMPGAGASQQGPVGAEEQQYRDRDRSNERQPVEDPNVLIPGREIPDLTEAQIVQKISQSARLEAKRAEIERLSTLVYGSSVAVSATVQSIDAAAAGSIASDDIHNGKISPLAGEEKRFLRAESPERQAARAHLPQLAAAMQDYGDTVDFERHQISTQHLKEQDRQRQAVMRPSADLIAVLRAPEHEQESRLRASPDLRHQLDRLTSSIDRRLDVKDRMALKAGDTAQLAQSLGVSRDRALALATVYSQTQGTQRQARMQRQLHDQNAALTIKR